MFVAATPVTVTVAEPGVSDPVTKTLAVRTVPSSDIEESTRIAVTALPFAGTKPLYLTLKDPVVPMASAIVTHPASSYELAPNVAPLIPSVSSGVGVSSLVVTDPPGYGVVVIRSVE